MDTSAQSFPVVLSWFFCSALRRPHSTEIDTLSTLETGILSMESTATAQSPRGWRQDRQTMRKLLLCLNSPSQSLSIELLLPKSVSLLRVDRSRTGSAFAIITPAPNLRGWGFKQYFQRLFHTLRIFTFPAVWYSGLQWGAQDAWLTFYLTVEEDNWYDPAVEL